MTDLIELARECFERAGREHQPSDDVRAYGMNARALSLFASRIREQVKEEDARDSARLDWLQERHETVYRCIHQERRPTTDAFRHYETVIVFDGWAVFEDQEPKPTIREAIDFAIRSTLPQGEEENKHG